MEYNDDSLALEFAARCEGTVCYDAERMAWCVWDGSVLAPEAMYPNGPRVYGNWKLDDTMKVQRLIRDVCREIAQQAEPKERARILSVARINAVERMARSDERLAKNRAELRVLARQMRSEIRKIA